MNSDNELHDLRFEGYTNDQLAQQIDGLRNGQGPQSLQDAAEALLTLAAELANTDKVLREQLQAIGVSWEGQAAEGGVQATQDAAVFADEAVGPVGDSAAGVATQSGEFSHTRHSAPDSGTLRGPTELNGFDRFAGAFGHTTDNAQRVKDTNAARDAAVSGMNGYQQGSADALGRARSLPVPPGINLVTRPPDTGTQVSSVGNFGGGSGAGPSGSPGTPGGPSGPGLPSGGPGSGPGPFTGPPGTPGGPPLPPGSPGPNTGIGPVTPFGPGPAGQPLPPGVPRPIPSLFVAESAAIANAGAAGAAVGSTADKDRLVRGRPGAPGTPGAPGSPGQESKIPAKGAQPLATPPDDEARAARNAERFGAKQGKPAGSPIMQPATGTAPGEEDKTHVRKYGVDSEDVFADERLTAPPLIGEQEADDKKAD